MSRGGGGGWSGEADAVEPTSGPLERSEPERAIAAIITITSELQPTSRTIRTGTIYASEI